MALKGIRVLTFSGMEMRAFGGFYYEAKKKFMWHFTNISSTWSSLAEPSRWSPRVECSCIFSRIASAVGCQEAVPIRSMVTRAR